MSIHGKKSASEGLSSHFLTKVGNLIGGNMTSFCTGPGFHQSGFHGSCQTLVIRILSRKDYKIIRCQICLLSGVFHCNLRKLLDFALCRNIDT